jgi:hypothetical protein
MMDTTLRVVTAGLRLRYLGLRCLRPRQLLWCRYATVHHKPKGYRYDDVRQLPSLNIDKWLP